jgi:Flp pilus assembly protein TadD
VDEASIQYQKGLKIRPNNAKAHNILGLILLQKGKVDAAIVQFQEALRIMPDFAEAHYVLGNALRQKGRVDEAISHFQRALQIKPDFAEAHNNLGTALRQKGRVDEAISHYQKALQIMPDNESVHVNLANAFLQKGGVDQAIVHFQNALQIEPADMEVQNNLAWLLATCAQSSLRNGDKAVQLARQANELAGGKNPVILGTLAAAFAEAGRFSEAVETAQRALRLAGAQSNTGLAGALQSEMKLYQAGKPFHSPEQTH